MKRRPTLLLLFLLLFAKSYVSAIPVSKNFTFPGHSTSTVRQANFMDADRIAISPQDNSFLNDDSDEEEDDSTPAVKQTFPAPLISSGNFFVCGLLAPRVKNARFPAGFHSSYPPVYLRLRVIRI